MQDDQSRIAINVLYDICTAAVGAPRVGTKARAKWDRTEDGQFYSKLYETIQAGLLARETFAAARPVSVAVH